MQFLVRTLLLPCRQLCHLIAPMLVSLWPQRDRECVLFAISSHSYKGINLIMRGPPSWPHLNCITSQMLHLVTRSYWVGVVQLWHIDFGWHKHAVCTSDLSGPIPLLTTARVQNGWISSNFSSVMNPRTHPQPNSDLFRSPWVLLC